MIRKLKAFAIGAFMTLVLCMSCINGTIAHDLSPRDCVIAVADAQMHAVVQGAQLCTGDTACIESEIQQRTLITAEYIEVCVQEKREHLPNEVRTLD